MMEEALNDGTTVSRVGVSYIITLVEGWPEKLIHFYNNGTRTNW